MSAAAATATWSPELFETLAPNRLDELQRFEDVDDDLDVPDCMRATPEPEAVEPKKDWQHAMAHDLNNCITALRLTFDLITEVEVSPQQLADLVDDGQEVLDRTAALVRELHKKGG